MHPVECAKDSLQREIMKYEWNLKYVQSEKIIANRLRSRSRRYASILPCAMG